jgi:IMP dehydrogenase
MFAKFEPTLTFDDVLLVPQHSSVLPSDVRLQTWLTQDIQLNLPFVSAPMDTVTQAKMAISLALSGGIGIIHKNLTTERQIHEVKKVKRFENGFIFKPATVGPDDTIQHVIDIRQQQGFKKTPVVDERGVLIGLISDIDYFIPDDAHMRVRDRMRPAHSMIVAKAGITLEQANQMIREYRLRTLCVVDSNGRLVSMVTRHDIEKNTMYPHAAKDHNRQLRVGAATGVGTVGIERAEALIAAGADAIVVDTAHGHSRGVIETVQQIKIMYSNAQVIAGNIATGDAAIALIDAGADAVKVGIGPGSICTTRVVAGIGVPQLSAILDVARTVSSYGRSVPVIADGGLKTSGDVVKALAAGASTVMMGNMFAGTDESPGRIEFIDGRMYKTYRGMGSIEAMELGSKDRYGQADVQQKIKYVPEGVSGRVPYKGTVEHIIYQLAGGLRSGMGYTGSATIQDLQANAYFVKISGSSLRESHPHDLGRIEDAPNYSVDE